MWLTGLPSAGKSTIARALAERLRAAGRAVEVLDGDEIRTELTADLGFSREDRDRQRAPHRLRGRGAGPQRGDRAGAGDRALRGRPATRCAPSTTPTATTVPRGAHRHPVEECAARDVKGLYAKQRAGEVSGLTGVDDPYEVPEKPDLRLDTSGHSLGRQCRRSARPAR